ncbi:MAG TPA: surface-adhesin E family protein [Parasulfuritortus sp.]
MIESQIRRQILAASLAFFAAQAAAQSDNMDEARRYLVRGAAAMEMAKTQDDFTAAANEFRHATTLAPGLATAWFNLGVVETKLNHYDAAIDAYRRYLLLSPKADDATQIGNEIVKLGYLQERYQAQSRLAGTWTASSAGSDPAKGDVYQVRFDDGKFVMTPSTKTWLGREVSLFTDKREPDHENSFNAAGAQLSFVGRLVDDRIVGERIQPETAISFNEEQPNCRLRELRTPFEGRLGKDGTTLTLSFNEPRYHVYWSYLGSFLGLGTAKSCRAVEEASSAPIELHLVRQQPPSSNPPSPSSQDVRPKSAHDYLVRGAVALGAAKSDDDLIVAEAEFKKAIEADPLSADAWYNLGLLYAKQKKYPEAVSAYQKYLEIKPSAENARQVEDEITRLKYFQERIPEQPKPGWSLLAKKTSGEREGDAVYIDKSTIKNQHGITSFAILWDYAKPPSGGWDFWSVIETHEINCEARQGRRTSMAAYAEHMGKGKLLYQSATANQAVYSGNTPGSLGKMLIDEVCR